jgi:transcriptional regulator with XRE-family HTH domain
MAFVSNSLRAQSPQQNRVPRRSTDEWESRIGEQFRELRVRTNLSQAELAERAGVSLGAVKNLERGRGSALSTVLRVAIALGQEDWLNGLSAEISISPIDVLRAGHARRMRVYRSRSEK